MEAHGYDQIPTGGFLDNNKKNIGNMEILAFLRTSNLDDQACVARSTNGEKTFQQWEKMGFQGHPLNALRHPDKRVLLTCYQFLWNLNEWSPPMYLNWHKVVKNYGQ